MVFVTLLAMGIATALLTMFLGKPTDGPINLITTIGMSLFAAITLVLLLNLSKINLEAIGLDTAGLAMNITNGVLAGFLALTIVGLLIQLAGGVSITYVFEASYLGPLLLGLVFFAFQGVFEELVFRGYLMPHFSKKLGVPFAIIGNSLLFALIHGMNPGITALPLINLFVFGVIFSLLYLLSGNLWLTGLAHSLWNYTQGFVFGSLVSGLNIKESVFKSTPVDGMELISGGKFGFEGSIITTIAGLILIAAMGVVAYQKGLFAKTAAEVSG